MRYSTLMIPTVKELPADAVVASHILMLRAGMIRKLAAGIYVYLPLARKVLHKIETIVREEMNRAGAQELLMPAVQPGELWKESGRWAKYGPELLRFKDRKGGEFCLGPTHEEVITWLFANEVNSYKQLPMNLYQIQNKFRDEVRPRFGLMRGREFMMKDAYSFHLTREECMEEYRVMYDAYMRIFTRCGLNFKAVEADTGSIGGSASHEFQVLAQSGEDAILACDQCDYAANVEKAESRGVAFEEVQVGNDPLTKVPTPGKHSIEEVSEFLKVGAEKLIKTLIYHDDDKNFTAVCIRGDQDVNEVKLKNHLDVNAVYLASDDDVVKVTGAPVGFAGPVGLKLPVVCDLSVKSVADGVTGALEKDMHYTGVNLGRDFTAESFADLRQAKDGEGCTRCEGGTLHAHRGIEVGQVFYLGRKYSEAMNGTVLDENGASKAVEMGCYGIGVTRTMAAAIEQNHDDNGIIWPMPLAPYQVVITPILYKEEMKEAADRLYTDLVEHGVDVILDDRNERAGVKFKDADLLGIPIRVTVGKKSIANGEFEWQLRRDGERRMAPMEQMTDIILETIRKEMDAHTPTKG